MKTLRALSFLVALAAPIFAADKRATSVVEMFGGAENLAIVRGAERVDACILRQIPPPKGEREDKERYEETPFVIVPANALASIREVVLTDATYTWDKLTLCWPRYHTRMRFQKDGKIVALDFCLECRLVQVLHEGSFVGNGLFNERPSALLAAFRQVFPDDQTLAKIR